MYINRCIQVKASAGSDPQEAACVADYGILCVGIKLRRLLRLRRQSEVRPFLSDLPVL